MDDLENKVIVFDDACPMCRAYTAGFVRLGWIERTGFSEASTEVLNRIDLNRARHEIPLLDTRTGEVRYGIDALFLILGDRLPWLKPLFRSRLFRAPVYQLYQLITYNRRIIAGSRWNGEGFDCAPDLNPFYRMLYIAIASTAGLWWIMAPAMREGGWALALPVLHGLFLTAGIFSSKKLDFLGHWATVLLAGGLVTAILPGGEWRFGLSAAITLWMWRLRWSLVA